MHRAWQRGQRNTGLGFFANGSVPMVAIETNTKMKPEDKTKMRADWSLSRLVAISIFLLFSYGGEKNYGK